MVFKTEGDLGVRVKIKLKKKAGRSGTPSRWVALGALTACATTRVGPATLLKAQQPGRGEQNLPVFRLAVEAGPLGETVAACEKATGWKLEIPDAGMTARSLKIPTAHKSSTCPPGTWSCSAPPAFTTCAPSLAEPASRPSSGFRA